VSIGLQGIANPSFPSGALGVWFAKDVVTSPRTIIPNRVGPNLTDNNILMASRRRFSDGQYWGNIFNAVTVTEGITAPDGSAEASSFVAASGSSWSIVSSNDPRTGTAETVNGQTYTIAVSVKSLSGGSLPFRFGASTLGNFTATTAYQRFTQTFVATGGCTVGIYEPLGNGVANFAVCDFELFAGSVDLNPNALTAKPVRVTNMNLYCSSEAGTVVSGGAFQGGSFGLIQLDQARNLNPFTFLYLTKHARTPTNYVHEGWISDPVNSSNFLIGKTFNLAAGRFNGTALAQGAVDGGGPQPLTLWGGNGIQAFVGAARYDGTAGSQFINGVKLCETVQTLTGPTLSDLAVGIVPGGGFTGFDIYAMAFYNRALTDAELLQATKALAYQSGVNVPKFRVLYAQGTSITAGSNDTGSAQGAEGFINNIAPLLSKFALGYNDGVPGSHLSINGTKLDAIVSAALANPFVTDFVLHLEYGANDDPPTSGLTTSIAAYCDARKAANPAIKIVVATILPRDSDADGGTAFNAGRAPVNTAIRGWIGVHCDAVTDGGGDPNIGPDGASLSTTYYTSEHIHLNHAGHQIYGPIAAAAINSI
jgi:hypothetical protein